MDKEASIVVLLCTGATGCGAGPVVGVVSLGGSGPREGLLSRTTTSPFMWWALYSLWLFLRDTLPPCLLLWHVEQHVSV